MHRLLLESMIHGGLETLLHQLLLHLVEVGHVALPPALRLPVPHVQVLLHLLHGQPGGGADQDNEGFAEHVLLSVSK